MSILCFYFFFLFYFILNFILLELSYAKILLVSMKIPRLFQELSSPNTYFCNIHDG